MKPASAVRLHHVDRIARHGTHANVTAPLIAPHKHLSIHPGCCPEQRPLFPSHTAMRQLSSEGQRLIADIAHRHGFSVDATSSLLDAVHRGNGGMAQFSHPEFGGSGQWMRGGMTMLSDLFNNQLKSRVDSLCSELARLVAEPSDLLPGSSETGGGETGVSRSDSASLFVAPAAGASADWRPSDLRFPNSTGAQNGVRYACFAQARRLVIDIGGTVTVYDTLDHRISGVSQQQSAGATLNFSSQHGPIDVASLPVVSSNGKPPAAASPGRGQQADVFATIEKLAGLKARGILSDEEFASKKAELLSRV